MVCGDRYVAGVEFDGEWDEEWWATGATELAALQALRDRLRGVSGDLTHGV